MAPLQDQMQRQLWATVRELHLLSAMDSSMQAYIDLNSCDIQPPENINDEDITAELGALPVGKPCGEIIDTSLQRILCESFSKRLQAAQSLHSGTGLAYADTIKLGKCDQGSLRQTIRIL
ncbi:hypothetical protein MY1884_009164 [Beauveria asiatica]